MLKRMLIVAGTLAYLTGMASAGQSCCAAKNAPGKATLSCCAKDTKTGAVKSAKSTGKKLTEVRVCPMMGEPVVGKGSGSQVVGAYNVHFCCGGCKPAFNKLPKAEQQKKIRDALKKQNAAKKAA